MCSDFIKNDIDPNGKIRGIAALGVILQGPFEVGSAIIVKGNLINMMLDLADSDNLIQEVKFLKLNNFVSWILQLCFICHRELPLKLLSIQHQKKIRLQVFFLRVLMCLRNSINQRINRLKSELLL